MSNIIQPDPSKIPDAIGKTSTAVEPFIPAKARAIIYSVAGVVSVAASAASPAVGGIVGDVLGIVGASAAAVVGATALSHVSG